MIAFFYSKILSLSFVLIVSYFMKQLLVLSLFFITSFAFSQKDSLRTGDRYLEDQLYLTVSYNQYHNQPEVLRSSGFSYGIGFGYIRDIPLVKSGHLALGVGVGYSYDSFNHGFKISEVNNLPVFTVDAIESSNPLSLNYIDVPLEFRWRTSTANRYKFWRIYAGVKFSYNIKNEFSFETTTGTQTYANVDRFNKFQYGLTLSTGYSSFNLYVYYGLTPLLKDAAAGTTTINSKILRMGLIFYIL